MSVNEITGDRQQTKAATDAYRDGYDAIFGFDKAWNTWVEHTKEFKPTNHEFAFFFFEQGRKCK